MKIANIIAAAKTKEEKLLVLQVLKRALEAELSEYGITLDKSKAMANAIAKK